LVSIIGNGLNNVPMFFGGNPSVSLTFFMIGAVLLSIEERKKEGIA